MQSSCYNENYNEENSIFSYDLTNNFNGNWRKVFTYPTNSHTTNSNYYITFNSAQNKFHFYLGKLKYVRGALILLTNPEHSRNMGYRLIQSGNDTLKMENLLSTNDSNQDTLLIGNYSTIRAASEVSF